MKYALIGIVLAAVVFWGTDRITPGPPQGQSCAEDLDASPEQSKWLMGYAKGYLTALNLISRGHGTMPGKQISMDDAAINAVIREYCAQHRANHYLDGVDLYVKNAR
ncbi:hypothetical protein I6I07_28765 [Achromobacter deleyi]|uniref:Rap1a immunity protein domain-containing protein n=1 Tax=Achromobacter deleyi TaxID=1353891 RepID=A0A7T4B2R0_9BURK|nr:hypothetical protein [Achromobacter deleyi]QQB34527.1 hypothetical protein I6I07_28765 [Achromobacter deleyi]